MMFLIAWLQTPCAEYQYRRLLNKIVTETATSCATVISVPAGATTCIDGQKVTGPLARIGFAPGTTLVDAQQVATRITQRVPRITRMMLEPN